MTNTQAAINDLDVKFTAKHAITIEVTEEQLHNEITSAIEGGTQYWARVNVGAHQAGWANYFTATFTVIEISDEKAGVVEGQSYTLSIEKLLKGLVVLRDKYPHHFCDILKEDGDATTGDVLVQCALFGEIVYG